MMHSSRKYFGSCFRPSKSLSIGYLKSVMNSLRRSQHRFNEINIQMLSAGLREQVFGKEPPHKCSDEENVINHLKTHELWGKQTDILPEIELNLPRLEGKNIDEHFRNIAFDQTKEYFKAANSIANATLPDKPKVWLKDPGWTKYNKDGSTERIIYPSDDALIFDVEICVTVGNFPVLATAASENAWYCWISDFLFSENEPSGNPVVDHMIPFDGVSLDDANKQRLLIGHNVSFDRSFVKEQYYLDESPTMFLDTMSLHMCVSGLTGSQRMLCNSKKEKRQNWMKFGSMNNLADVYNLYTGKGKLDKAGRDVFVDGNLDEVRQTFQESVFYCASDVSATHDVFSKVWPQFLKHAPHPVTFAGMLQMGKAYLPINNSWQDYVKSTQERFDELEDEMKQALMRLANETCRSFNRKSYQNNAWTWSLDWSTQDLRLKKESPLPKSKKGLDKVESKKSKAAELVDRLMSLTTEELATADIEDWYPDVPRADDVLPKRRQHLAGYPKYSTENKSNPLIMQAKDNNYGSWTIANVHELHANCSRHDNIKRSMERCGKVDIFLGWYRDLCINISKEEWEPGPFLLSPQTRISPLLLQMTWDGYPLFFSSKYGWGYVVPGRTDNLGTQLYDPPLKETKSQSDDSNKLILDPNVVVPESSVFVVSPNVSINESETNAPSLTEDTFAELGDLSLSTEEEFINDADKNESNNHELHNGLGPFNDVNLPGLWFYKIPHKNGEQYRCGNPLGRDYLAKMEDGTLASYGSYNASRTLEINKMISFWRNAHKRVKSQLTIYPDEKYLPDEMKSHSTFKSNDQYGVIIPRVVTAGTVTRRAVEITWLTASNPMTDRVGSELKSLVRSPPSYCLVGADVDSQELWIAAVLGDSGFAGIHGATALSWMTLQGKKSEGTDLHSKTAKTIGISRDHAKVFNYGRIYGAGQKYAKRLLLQFNHRLTEKEAADRAAQLYASTKGKARYHLEEKGLQLAKKYYLPIENDNTISANQFYSLLRKCRIRDKDKHLIATRKWTGGSESEMFNKLESIATSAKPKTPVLGVTISRPLQPSAVGDLFMTSRINWVVQSSAVDYLHIMLVCMKWLFTKYKIKGRFCISIHDEVRYLVHEDDKYRAALALQITNLFTRSLFAFKLNMNDLPQSVAFFSAVDIDTVLRKEVTMDCETPSNPLGIRKRYGIQEGESLDIFDVLKKTNGSLDAQDSKCYKYSATL